MPMAEKGDTQIALEAIQRARAAEARVAKLEAALNVAHYWMQLGFKGEAAGRSGAGEADAEVRAALATDTPSGTCDARVVRYDDYERCDRPGNPCDRHRVETKGDEAK